MEVMSVQGLRFFDLNGRFNGFWQVRHLLAGLFRRVLAQLSEFPLQQVQHIALRNLEFLGHRVGDFRHAALERENDLGGELHHGGARGIRFRQRARRLHVGDGRVAVDALQLLKLLLLDL